MKYYQIIFRPTGGTEMVAKTVTQNWKQVETIDLTLPAADYSKIFFEKDSLVLIAMPSFVGIAPQLALERFSMVKGNGALCVIAAVYGNRAYEDTLVQMQDYAQTAGFRVIAAISAVAEHSIIRKYAAGAISPDQLKLCDKSKCISCMRCVSICPVHARKVSQLMTSVAAAALKKACSVEKENELFI